MNVGHYISGLGHIVLLSWAFLGNLFEQDYKSVEIVKISVISSEQYADSVLSDEAPLIASQIENLSSPIVQGQNLPDTTRDIEKVEISKMNQEGPVDDYLDYVRPYMGLEIARNQWGEEALK